MEFIVASIAFVINFAYLILLMLAAMSIVAYLLGAIIELCEQLLDERMRSQVGTHTLRDMHSAGFATLSGVFGGSTAYLRTGPAVH